MRCQKGAASSGRGLIQPRRPASTMTAGNNVTAPTKAVAMPMARPVVEKSPSLANPIPRKVTPTVAAEAAITLPMEGNARSTAWSLSSPV